MTHVVGISLHGVGGGVGQDLALGLAGQRAALVLEPHQSLALYFVVELSDGGQELFQGPVVHVFL